MERFNSSSSDQIVLTKRQASMIMASMLLFCLFVFIIGFFLGKRTVIEDFSTKITKEALHDQIDFLLTTQSLESSQEEATSTIETESSDALIGIENQESIMPAIFSQERISQAGTVSAEIKAIDDTASKVYITSDEETSVQGNKLSQTPQYAQLIGFGTKKAAQAFVSRLKKHNVPVILKTMISKTASGKQKTWYQAITPTYNSAEELQSQIAKIKRLEHIREKDIKIIHAK
ncbi:MAG: SPOR domain-containing protein [Candidatus Dependentiae bacterium]|nr:SPOR domain-containing protein [Candidatus Dependentiae bacterium]